MPQNNPKADFGFDGSSRKFIVLPLLLFGAAGLTLQSSLTVFKVIGYLLLSIGFAISTVSIYYFLYVKIGKFLIRDRLLSMVHWSGNETVLDVGTGRGLLMVGAAKKAVHGKSIGIDIWRQEDMQDNSYQNTMRNVRLEGVEERVELRNEDVRELSFTDNFFDVILSNLCIHNIDDAEGRDQALKEIARVLKPGGVALICDILHFRHYAEVFKAEGLVAEILDWHLLEGFPWQRTVMASKPKA